MALVAKFKLQLDVLGESIWAVLQTGQYDPIANLGGFGDPNEDLNTLAIMALAYKLNSDGVKENLEAVGSYLNHDNGAANTDELDIQFKYLQDGRHFVYFFILPVSTDGINDLNANPLNINDYFYQSGKLYLMTGSGPVEVLDVFTYLDDENIDEPTASCEEFYLSNLIKFNAKQYVKYIEQRNGPVSEDPLWEKIRMLKDDIKSTDTVFRVGNQLVASQIVESLLKENGL